MTMKELALNVPNSTQNKFCVFFHLLGTVLYEVPSGAKKYNRDVNWYTSWRYNGLDIVNFTKGTTGGNNVSNRSPICMFEKNEKTHSFYMLVVGRNWYFVTVRKLCIHSGTSTKGK